MDLEKEGYALYLLVDSNTPAATVGALTRAANDALRDSNVDFEIINVSELPGHEALERWRRATTPGTSEAASPPLTTPGVSVADQPARARDALPGALLCSPDGQMLRVMLPAPSPDFAAALTAVLGSVAVSAVRSSLVTQVSQAFALVLLLEGPDAAANGRARQAIDEAIAETRAQMPSMPKAVMAPPERLVVPRAGLVSERVLLWSLGLDSADLAQPHAAVVYGRGRWIGPLMKGPEIRAVNLNRLLNVVGLDCECGLDLAWTRGTRLPVCWDAALQAQTASRLGFDPESPMVKAEVSRIVGRYRLLAGQGGGPAAGPAAPATPPPLRPVPSAQPAREPRSPLFGVWLAGGGLAAVSLVVGLWILWRRAASGER